MATRKDRMSGIEGDSGHRESYKEKNGRRAGQRLNAFKTFVLVALMVATTYGMLNQGLFGEERWTPVAGGILGLLFLTLFVRGFYADVARVGWILISLLAILVAVKGLSLAWSISPIETVEELLRSSMYLATFILASAALSSARVIPSFVDGVNLIVFAVAGYGLLQKINPVEYNPGSMGGERIISTLGYANTVAVVLAMGMVLGLARMTQLKLPLGRGVYAAALLVFSVALYFTFSRGGILVLGLGLIVLFILTRERLQMFANLLLFCVPLAWLVLRSQGYQALVAFRASGEERLADGVAFRSDLMMAVVVAFLLQVGYAVFVGRYELVPIVRRVLGAAVIVVVVAAGSLGASWFSNQQEEPGGSLGNVDMGSENVDGVDGNVSDRLTSASANSRDKYWSVAWEEWKEHPLTGTGAGTFHYTWMENRPGYSGVRQVHNVYLEQGTETGVFAFLALGSFAGLLGVYLIWTTWKASGERRVLLAGLTAAVGVYLLHSGLEWHWYIPPSTLFFFVIAAVAVKFAAMTGREMAEKAEAR